VFNETHDDKPPQPLVPVEFRASLQPFMRSVHWLNPLSHRGKPSYFNQDRSKLNQMKKHQIPTGAEYPRIMMMMMMMTMIIIMSVFIRFWTTFLDFGPFRFCFFSFLNFLK